jgi:hypothetical protein
LKQPRAARVPVRGAARARPRRLLLLMIAHGCGSFRGSGWGQGRGQSPPLWGSSGATPPASVLGIPGHPKDAAVCTTHSWSHCSPYGLLRKPGKTESQNHGRGQDVFCSVVATFRVRNAAQREQGRMHRIRSCSLKKTRTTRQCRAVRNTAGGMLGAEGCGLLKLDAA